VEACALATESTARSKHRRLLRVHRHGRDVGADLEIAAVRALKPGIAFDTTLERLIADDRRRVHDTCLMQSQYRHSKNAQRQARGTCVRDIVNGRVVKTSAPGQSEALDYFKSWRLAHRRVSVDAAVALPLIIPRRSDSRW